MNVDLSMSRMQWEKTESKRAQGRAGRPRSVAGRPHFVPKNSEIFSKFTWKSLISFLPLILEIRKDNVEKKILKKRNPNLDNYAIYVAQLVDVIIITQGNQGHPLPQNPKKFDSRNNLRH
jgi:hypothetical protein